MSYSDVDSLLIATQYTVRQHFDTMTGNAVTFNLTNSPHYPGVRMAVRRSGMCLGIDGQWEIEPTPSSRDDDFYARCRFRNLGDALEVYKKTTL